MDNKARIKIKNRTQNSMGISIVGFILTTMAGWVDTIGVNLFLNQKSAYMTGQGHILGYWAYKLEFRIFIGIVLIIIAFITGACISTIIAKKTELIGSLFFVGILIIMASFPFVLQHQALCIIFLSMAMGCQNAATSLTEIRRTTHLTGPSTDIGISIAKGNWKMVRFWSYRWIGFPLGSFIGFSLMNLVYNNIISKSVTLIIPAIIIISTGIIQNNYLDIPILEEQLQENIKDESV